MAVATAKFSLTNAGWTDLGAGPMLLTFRGVGVYAVGDAAPAWLAEGFSRSRGGAIRLTTTSHVWASASGAAGVDAYVAPIVPVSAWTPAKLPGLVAWYDGQKASSIILNGATVSQWNDQSPNAYNAVQGTAANQPTYSAVGFNGKPALSFNGTSNYLSAPVPAGAFPNGIFEAIVFYTSLVSHGPMPRATGSISAGLDRQGTQFLIGNGTTNTGLAPAPTISTGAMTTPTLWEVYCDNSARIGYDWVNATSDCTSSVYSAGAYADNATTLFIGNRQDLPVQYIKGPIAEAVACRQMATADRQSLEGYLAWKWGLQSLLPAGHPYKGGFPPQFVAPPLLTGAESDGINLGLSLIPSAATTPAAPSIVAPDGTTGAVVALTEDTSATANHYVYTNFTGAPTTATISAYVKPFGSGSTRYVVLSLENASFGGGSAYFNVANGIVNTAFTQANYTITNAVCQPAANGFFKCTLSMTTTSTGFSFGIFALSNVATSSSLLSPYTGDGASGLYCWRFKETTP